MGAQGRTGEFVVITEPLNKPGGTMHRLRAIAAALLLAVALSTTAVAAQAPRICCKVYAPHIVKNPYSLEGDKRDAAAFAAVGMGER